MNYNRNPVIEAIYLVTLLTLSSCSGQKLVQTSATPSDTPLATPSEVSVPTATPSETSTTVSPTSSEVGVKPQGTSCPADAPIKAKTGKRGKIYYPPQSRNYNRVKPEECFPDAAAAQKAGYHAPKQLKV